MPIELLRGTAEALPFPDGAFDSIVMTYTLCSIDDPERALAELRRVLRPDGELLFVEHGLAHDAGTQRWQRRLPPRGGASPVDVTSTATRASSSRRRGFAAPT